VVSFPSVNGSTITYKYSYTCNRRDSSAIGHKEVLQYATRRWYDSGDSLQAYSLPKRVKKIAIETDKEGTMTRH
jgi:hypothetical protein